MAKGKGFISEFKTFIMRGNVIDLAVGVIIGGAFQKIVNSLVNDIIMPVISLLTGGIDFSNWFLVLGEDSVFVLRFLQRGKYSISEVENQAANACTHDAVTGGRARCSRGARCR